MKQIKEFSGIKEKAEAKLAGRSILDIKEEAQEKKKIEETSK